MSPRLDFTPFRTHYFFLLTTVLAITAWFVALIGQAIATAQVGNKFVGVLWFAIFLQGFLTAGVICTIATDSVQTHRLQLAAFGSIAIVFAVQGVQEGIFSALPSLVVMSIAYLIFALIDILWVLYFTSEEDSLAMHIFNQLGTGGLAPPARRRRARAQSVASSGLGVGYDKGKPNYALGGGVSSLDLAMAQEPKRASASPSLARSGTGKLKRSGTGGRSITSRKSLVSIHAPEAKDAVSSPVDATPPMPAIPPPVVTVSAGPTDSRENLAIALPVPEAPRTVPPVVPVPAETNQSRSGPGAEASPSPVTVTVSPRALPPTAGQPAGRAERDDDDDDDEFPLRGKALHAYKGSPDDPSELSFAKGEILEIEDQEGKWWQARKADGTLGIVPSNYLVII
ncbi:hypothetical protein C8R44DRAFT_324943 [Mycena epipterygia]|nr:hypothetical protein C8R44DRAFT_324943 [Mycena epipterygia]